MLEGILAVMLVADVSSSFATATEVVKMTDAEKLPYLGAFAVAVSIACAAGIYFSRANPTQ